jgi:ubiquinol-cytochrome c reductase iron-sulfur subunit
LAETTSHPITTPPETREVDPRHPTGATRRDFMILATGAFAAIGTVAVIWPLIDQMNPDATALALASTDVDLSAIEPGQSVTVTWRSKPVFIRYRTEQEIEAARAVPLADLPDRLARNENLPDNAPATDENRAVPDRPEWLIQVGICTHFGCVPIGEQGDHRGWFCPCHGSHYDTSGRIRRGPAPENLLIPQYVFLDDTTVRIG